MFLYGCAPLRIMSFWGGYFTPSAWPCQRPAPQPNAAYLMIPKHAPAPFPFADVAYRALAGSHMKSNCLQDSSIPPKLPAQHPWKPAVQISHIALLPIGYHPQALCSYFGMLILSPETLKAFIYLHAFSLKFSLFCLSLWFPTFSFKW